MTYEVEETSPEGEWHLPGEIRVAEAHDLYDDLAIAFASAALEAVKARGCFHVALSGGSTPEPFYMHLVIDPRYRAIPWEKSHLWIVDERRVAEDHEKSNVRMIRHVLTDHLPMKKRQLHPMPVLLDDPAGAYIEELSRVFESAAASQPGAGLATGDAIPRLDFVLLGMGDDAHTASLFPHSPALNEKERWVANNDGPKVTPPPRVTMTYPLLNAAREIAVLCVGAKKLPTLQRVSEQMKTGPDPANLPITGIAPTAGTLTWYLDTAAAGE
jgi:6-phosphogluconolactonase